MLRWKLKYVQIKQIGTIESDHVNNHIYVQIKLGFMNGNT